MNRDAARRATRSMMSRRAIARTLLIAAVLVTATGTADAHGVIGLRMFIEPLAAEDANVKNELGLPRGDFLRLPDGTIRSLDASLEKELYPRRLSIIAEIGRVSRTGPDASGWDNIEIGFKWEAWINESHEVAVSGAMFATLPTGSAAVTDRETALRPMLLAAKGFGDLGVGWLRPLALQGDVGYEGSIGDPGSELVYDAVLMYSLPYLNHWVRRADAGRDLEHTLRTGLSWGSLWGNLFPFVELNARRPIGAGQGERSALLRSGACWMGRYLQVSVAADINLTGPAGARHHGVTVLADWFLDEILPGFGKTPFGPRAPE